MAHLLFRLRHVTDEEALEVRRLLDERGFDVYETQAGFFRLGVDAIWLRDSSQREAAEAALAEYQQARRQRERAAFEQARARGEAPTLWRRFLAHPIQVVLTIVAVLLVALLTLLPFLGLNAL
ncbi:DUF6164 family protein [Halomonas sp. PAMB 3264]|uniref:DUF6164 family protein n=1 Tax=unclassified Halomonas TaxID=2609666 RepID=UPI0028978090|nr:MULTISPECIES: DUF6164 family protein [unclassified Halomonas]WNL38748.1 DUF6164 family protein [Halomonas sp. PAMB 3232]WNL42087.1 DUF6164 family protein [Halomonas sp. PAMB 3264]